MNKRNKTDIEIETLSEVLIKLGKLKYSLDKAMMVLRGKFPKHDLAELEQRIKTEGTEEYFSYNSGLASALFDIESRLYDKAAQGDTFAQEALSNIQTQSTVNVAIKEKFFPSKEN